MGVCIKALHILAFILFFPKEDYKLNVSLRKMSLQKLPFGYSEVFCSRTVPQIPQLYVKVVESRKAQVRATCLCLAGDLKADGIGYSACYKAGRNSPK